MSSSRKMGISSSRILSSGFRSRNCRSKLIYIDIQWMYLTSSYIFFPLKMLCKQKSFPTILFICILHGRQNKFWKSCQNCKKKEKESFNFFNSFIAKYVRFGSIFVFVTPKYLVRWSFRSNITNHFFLYKLGVARVFPSRHFALCCESKQEM